MPKIFICYRRGDNTYPPHIIYDGLKKRYGANSVVLDVDTIPLGTDFRAYLNEQVGRCDILLAVIGDKWQDILNQRLNDSDDFVRIEIQAALRKNIPVVPILVDKASMPNEKDLPQELQRLAFMQAAEVRSSRDLQAELDRLFSSLDSLLDSLLAKLKAEEEEKRKAERAGTHWLRFLNPRRAAELERALKYTRREIEVGRKVQVGFVPDRLPAPSGWEIVAHFQPALDMRGDFYDVFTMPGGRCLGIVIADVCGGTSNSNFWMAMTRTLIRAFAMQGADHIVFNPTDPAGWSKILAMETARQTNVYLTDNHGDVGIFAALFWGVLDLTTGQLTYINCGEEALFLRNGRLTAYLKRTVAGLGWSPDLTYNTESIAFEAGDCLFLYTDGVIDADNSEGVIFSKQRLVDVVSGKTASAQTLLNNVIKEMNAHLGKYPPSDDVTLLAIRKIHASTDI